jgi:hypothetical protein
MRAVKLADIEAAARAAMCCRPAARSTLVARLMMQADMADKYRKHLRKPHPLFGTGTLMSAAGKHPQVARPEILDSNTLDAFAHVINALQSRTDKSNLVK